MTSASHAEGRQFDPGQVYALLMDASKYNTQAPSEASMALANAWRAVLAPMGQHEQHPSPTLAGGAHTVSYGVRTHAELPPVDLKSTPLTTRAN